MCLSDDSLEPNALVSEGVIRAKTSTGNMSAGDNLHEHVKTSGLKHIAICICTYKRPQPLKRLLEELLRQENEGEFTYSVVVADNDASRSAEHVTSEFAQMSDVAVKYCVEPRQGISLARNMVVGNASGDFLAFIDDDEFPSKNWLSNMLKTCTEYGVDGVLGPVKEHFNKTPPKWILKGKFFQRPTYPTGTVLSWMNTRTGNVLIRSDVFDGITEPFRPQFRSGEDQDFFRRMIDKGRVFIWCDEAQVYEPVLPSRYKRTYMLRRALLFGSMWAVHNRCTLHDVVKSVIAVLAYMVALPFALVLGHHRFMTLMVKLCHHLGKLLSYLGINPIREAYLSE